jgi:hypothetical protein
MSTNKPAPRKNAPARTGAGAKKPATGEVGTGVVVAGNSFAREVFRRAIDALHADLLMQLECKR